MLCVISVIAALLQPLEPVSAGRQGSGRGRSTPNCGQIVLRRVVKSHIRSAGADTGAAAREINVRFADIYALNEAFVLKRGEIPVCNCA